jgi:hypothetical protein
LQLQHFLAELLGRDIASLAAVADFLILAVNTMQIAAGEKDGSRAARATDGRLLPQMQRRTSDADMIRAAARTVFTSCSVNAAAAWALRTYTHV